MTLDERITALTTDLELLRGMMKDSLERTDKHGDQMRRMEVREKQLRTAVLKAMKAYLDELANGGEPEEDRHE